MRNLMLALASVLLAACATAPKSPAPIGVLEVADATPPPVEALSLEPSAQPAPEPVAALPVYSPTPERWMIPEPQVKSRSSRPAWRQHQAYLQGWFGVTSLTSSSRSGGTVPGPPGGDVDLGSLPVIGGGGQWKMNSGDGIDFGLEGGVNFAFRTNGSFFATGSNGAVVGVSIDALIFDLYGGAFVSKYLGDKARIYGSAGPLLQWASYDQSSLDPTYNGTGSGFGVGYYVRLGFEFVVSPSTMVGLGGRWFDSDVNLSGELGDWNLSGAQVLFTVTRTM